MMLGAVLIQWTAAIVIPVFAVIGPSAASAWRFALGAIVLLALTRPDVRHWSRRQWLGALALGVTTAFMNLCFYQAIARIPLGGAVAIEYLGPFCVAALGKRTPRHLAFVALAGAGVVALTRPGSGLTFIGVLFAAGAGLGWAAYIFASQRVGGTTKGFGGLAVSMSVAAALTLPLSLGASAKLIDHPDTLLRISIVAIVAIALGFGSELEGLRRLKPSIAGVLMAGDPAVAFLIGWLLLNQVARGWDLVGLGCVVVAGAGVMLDSTVSESELAQ
ncbi:MAG TPA: EamA family transporter [Acidimicrobiales bacterium]|nr:EamA family transporter [Acidimicrobiales bacterium]